MIDWSQIKTIEDIFKLDENLLYDEAGIVTPSDMLKLSSGLTDEEIEDAKFWVNYHRGLMLITGEPGGGKGITAHLIAKKMDYYFKKVPILDTRPRKSFGAYIPFSEEMMAEQIDRMSEMETGIVRPHTIKGLTSLDFDGDPEGFAEYLASPPLEQYEELKQMGRVPANVTLQDYNKRRNEFTATAEFKSFVDKDGKWITSRGEMLLRNSTVMMDEFGSKYMSRLSSPTLSIKQVLLKLFNFWRHMQCLMLGVGVSLDDFDRKCLDKALWEAKCVRVYHSDENEDDPNAIIIGVYLTPIKYNPFQDELSKAGTTALLRINASKPQNMLDGKCWKDIYNTENAQGFELPQKYRRRQ